MDNRNDAHDSSFVYFMLNMRAKFFDQGKSRAQLVFWYDTDQGHSMLEIRSHGDLGYADHSAQRRLKISEEYLVDILTQEGSDLLRSFAHSFYSYISSKNSKVSPTATRGSPWYSMPTSLPATTSFISCLADCRFINWAMLSTWPFL